MAIRILLIIGWLTCLSGCLNHPDMRVESSVTLADLSGDVHGNADWERIEDGVHALEAAPTTTGRFPSGIAVVRVTKAPDRETGQDKLSILPFRGFEEPYWLELFDGTPEVRSVFAIHKKSVRDETVTLPELWRAAEVANAGLLLVYGYDNTEPEEFCRVIGLLYEIPGGKPVAAIRNTAALADAGVAAEQLPDRAKPATDGDWAFYLDHHAFRGFERHFKTCIWELIDKDQFREELKPNPFENPRPTYPRVGRRQDS